MMNSQIASRIVANLTHSGDKVVIYFGDKQIKAAEFLDLIQIYRRGLINLHRHENIAILMKTSPDALALFIASLSVAKNTCFFDPNWPEDIIKKTANLAQIDMIISDDSQSAVDTLSHLVLKTPTVTADHEAEAEVNNLDGNYDPNYTCFTSGSTGLPKGCMRSEMSWIRSFGSDQKFTDIQESDTVIVPGSFAHSLFLYAAIRGLYTGATIALFTNFHPNRIVEIFEHINNGVIFAVPTQLDALVHSTCQHGENIKRILSTGSKLPVSIYEKLVDVFTEAVIVEFYGTSELSYVAARTVSVDDPETLVGRPLPNVEISIKGPDGADIPIGSEGLVYVKSDLAFRGYVSHSGLQEADKSICVGDAGFFDFNGDLHLVGRMDRAFQSSGRNIIPEAIETALTSIEGVTLAAVFGVPDATRENRIAAVLCIDAQITKPDLISCLRQSLATYAIPSIYYKCDIWPKTTSGKIDLITLRSKLLAKELEVLF
jgi:long-chain acyl-CoA synthetase